MNCYSVQLGQALISVWVFRGLGFVSGSLFGLFRFQTHLCQMIMEGRWRLFYKCVHLNSPELVCKSVDLLDLLAIIATFLSHYTVQTLTVLRRVAFATFSLELLFSTENLRHFILKTHWLSSSKSTLTSLCSFKHGFYDYN